MTLLSLGRLSTRPYWIWGAFLCLSMLAANLRADISADERQVRAAVVMGIIRYTRWQENPGSVLNICLYGHSDSFQFLKKFSGRQLQNKTSVVVMTKPTGNDCHVFVAGRNAEQAMPGLDDKQLVICESCNLQKVKAAVIIRKHNNRIRFDVNMRAARAQNLEFSTSMLELAARVEGVDG